MSDNRANHASPAARDDTRGAAHRAETRQRAPHAGHADQHRTVCSLRQAAWTLGITASELSRAIRQGTIRTERRRSRLVITAAELARHLPNPTNSRASDTDPPLAMRDTQWLEATLNALERYRHVPRAVIAEIVFRDCAHPWPDEHPPAGSSDAELARQTCAGCLSPYACLELELRLGGDESVGVWGGLSEQDRRVLYRAWLADRHGEDPPPSQATDSASDEDREGWV